MHSNAENTSDFPKTLLFPSEYCFLESETAGFFGVRKSLYMNIKRFVFLQKKKKGKKKINKIKNNHVIDTAANQIIPYYLSYKMFFSPF